VFLENANTSRNGIQGNRVGIGITGGALPNDVGIIVLNGASDNLIGGTTAGAGNIIADNTQQGVVIGNNTSDTTTTGNAILGNSIFGNGGLGIDLSADGVTANHTGSASGPNHLQNYPVLTAARLIGGDVVVQGTLNSLANTTFRIEFFASASADVSGHGQGQFFLGYVTVTTDASGNGSFAAVFPFVAKPDTISATATEVTGNNTAGNLTFGDTSEFSADITATI
jgi:titin